MFTGIVETIGRVQNIHKSDGSLIFKIKIDNLNSSIGDSVCVNGVCLTVEAIENNMFSFSISPETYKLCNLDRIQSNDQVNIETSLTLNKLLSGHIVLGHIDTTAEIIELYQIDNSWFVKFQIESKYIKYIIQKGSITIDGVSLTINDIHNNEFSVMIIPHTWQNTIFKNYGIGNIVNIEVDVLAKYVEKLGNKND